MNKTLVPAVDRSNTKLKDKELLHKTICKELWESVETVIMMTKMTLSMRRDMLKNKNSNIITNRSHSHRDLRIPTIIIIRNNLKEAITEILDKVRDNLRKMLVNLNLNRKRLSSNLKSSSQRRKVSHQQLPSTRKRKKARQQKLKQNLNTSLR